MKKLYETIRHGVNGNLFLSLHQYYFKIVEADRIVKGIHPNPNIKIANLKQSFKQ